MQALQITEERTFTARINERTVTGLAVAGAWEGLTKYVSANGEHLIVLDAEARVLTGSAALLGLLNLAPDVAVDLAAGEMYIGIADGQHVILLAGDIQKPWAECMEWAKSIGGDLPTRAEQKLLFEKAKGQFKDAWYWSNTQHAAYSDYAWFQYFDYGYQDYYHKSGQGRARAVRRLPI